MLTELICRVFVKNHADVQNPRVRKRYGTLTACVGIFINILLFAGKFIVGTLTASIAITADAINNLSDAGSSVISLISFRIQAKPADKEHPFGHARIEYVASMIVSFLILFIGISLFRESLDKIIHGGEPTDPSLVAIIVLCASILCKLWLFLFNRRLGKKIDSSVMKATALDSLSDALSTSAVLAATLIYRFSGVELDAYMGLLVALFILWSGIKIFRETTDSILGGAPDGEVIDSIKKVVFSHPEAIGIHDIMVHSYGPGRFFASAHVEVDGAKDIYASHDAVDNMEKELSEKHGIQCVLHLDPIAVGDEKTDFLKTEALSAAHDIDERITLHDFRIVPGTTHTNLIFDLVVPFEEKRSDDEITELMQAGIAERQPQCFAVITVDRH